MPNNTVNDGTVVYGSLQLSINGTTWETDDLTVDFDVEKIVRKNSLNVPTGRVMVQQETTGSATLMYPSPSVAKPPFGAQFSFTDDGITYSCSVEKCGKRRTKNGESKIPITFVVNITGSVALSQN